MITRNRESGREGVLDGGEIRLLLDTHAFIWWDSDPQRIPHRILELRQDPVNELLLSVASLWETQIKSQLGKLKIRHSLPKLVEAQQESNGLIVLPIRAPHVYRLEELPALHKDPFDRIRVAQAIVENLVLIGSDEAVRQYPVEVHW